MSTIEIAAFVLGVINVALVVRRSIWNYPFALVMVLLYARIFYDAKLYSDALLQFFFFAVNLYGWWAWGRAAASEISRNLIDAGRHPDTPVMVAVNVSLPTERLIRGKLSALAFLVQAVSDKEPTLLLIGEAVVDHGRAEAQGNRALLPA